MFISLNSFIHYKKNNFFLYHILLLKDQDDGTTDSIDGTQWINTTAPVPITDLQPRISSQLNVETADSYFDFDMEPESPGSPIEDCECEYTRLIETTVSTPQEPQAPESGFVCASPCSTQEGESRGSASSSEAQFFDPESSDTGTEFFDCPPPPTNAEQMHHTHSHLGRPQRRVYHHLSHNKIAVRPPSPIQNEHEPPLSPSSSSSSATPTSKMNGHVRLVELNDSSESLPPSQSTSSNLNCDDSNSNSNSTLQDADAEMPLNDFPGVCEIPVYKDVKFEKNDNNINGNDDDDKCTLHNFDAVRTVFIKYNEEDDKSPEKETSPLDNLHLLTSSPEQEQECEVAFDQDKILNEITTKTEEIELTVKDEQSQQQEVVDDKESTPEPDEKKKPRKDSDEESEYERPPRVRRCSSLKTGKTPPGTPGRKKFVRFADVLGLDLADVRTFLDEVPKIPKSAYEDLDVTLPSNTISLGPPLDKVLVPLFQQPGCLPNFLERLRDGQVCLESAAVTDPINLTITGCVRVRNLDFHKSVHIRYSLDSWRSHSDLSASYVDNSCDGFSDKFSFILFGNSLQIGQRVEMAIRFQCKGEQYWDGNYGTNYCFQCLPCNSHRTSPIMASSESSLSSSNGGSSNSSSMPNETSSSSSVSTFVDSTGQRQWSNSFLY